LQSFHLTPSPPRRDYSATAADSRIPAFKRDRPTAPSADSQTMTKIKRHAPALCALLLLNIVVFARLVFHDQQHVPYATIPFDFASQYSVWLVYIGDCFK